MFYISLQSDIAKANTLWKEIKNNIFESCKDAAGVYFGEDAKVNGLQFSNNYYKDSPQLLEAYSQGQTAYDPDPTEYTGSAFKKAEDNDFTISNATLLNAEVGNTEFKVAE